MKPNSFVLSLVDERRPAHVVPVPVEGDLPGEGARAGSGGRALKGSAGVKSQSKNLANWGLI